MQNDAANSNAVTEAIKNALHFSNLPWDNEGRDKPFATCSGCASDSVHVIFDLFGDIKVDDVPHVVDIQTTTRHISGRQNADFLFSETVHHREAP
jgi:hypothetical protein